MTGTRGLERPSTGMFCTLSTMSYPSSTRPNTTAHVAGRLAEAQHLISLSDRCVVVAKTERVPRRAHRESGTMLQTRDLSNLRGQAILATWLNYRRSLAPCLPSSQGVGPVVMKNCEPFVFLPALAMERTPVACFTLKFSSGNFLP